MAIDNFKNLTRKDLFYFRRTIEHIQRVQENALFLVENYAKRLWLSLTDCRMLMHNVSVHDSSKFSKKQFSPYVKFSWHKKEKIKIGERLSVLFKEAWKNHYTAENHHPEKLKNSENRIDQFSKVELIEIACDLQAMAQEFGNYSGREYFNETWIKKQRKNFHRDDWERSIGVIEECFDCFEEGTEGASS